MKKIILIIVIVMIAGLGGYFLLRGGYQYQDQYQDQAPVSSSTPAPGVDPGDVEEKIVSEGTTEIKEFTVSGTEYSFSPSSITVSAGDQVKISFKNTGRLSHNFIIDGLGIGTVTIGAGQSDMVEFIAPASGTYTIFCSVPGHRVAGMIGTLKVE